MTLTEKDCVPFASFPIPCRIIKCMTQGFITEMILYLWVDCPHTRLVPRRAAYHMTDRANQFTFIYPASAHLLLLCQQSISSQDIFECCCLSYSCLTHSSHEIICIDADKPLNRDNNRNLPVFCCFCTRQRMGIFRSMNMHQLRPFPINYIRKKRLFSLVISLISFSYRNKIILYGILIYTQQTLTII